MNLFYGKVTTKNGNLGPPMTVMHQSIQQMTYRFDRHLKSNFSELVKLVQNDASVLELFTDEGVGEAPPALLAAVENGLRASALHRQMIFSADSIISEAKWRDQNQFWRHRATYYVICRLLLESPNLSTYTRYVMMIGCHRM